MADIGSHSLRTLVGIWSNPTDRLNRELKRRTDVVQIFPDVESVIRLVGALLVEMNDERIAADRRYFAADSVAASSIPPTVYRPGPQPPAPDDWRRKVLHHTAGLNQTTLEREDLRQDF